MSSDSQCCCGTELLIDPPWSDAHCFVAITGASRGFGRALCLQLVNALSTMPGQAKSVNFLLMSRLEGGAEETKCLIHMAKCTGSTTKVCVLIAHPAIDMAEATESNLRLAIKPLIDLASSEEFRDKKQWNLLINNAGSLGLTTERADERTCVSYLKQYYRANLIAPIILTSLFLDHFAPFNKYHEPVTVVNVSSLAADRPFRYLSDYCAAKAARQMYFRCVALDRPTVAVFNYSPGPMRTQMYEDMVSGFNLHSKQSEASLHRLLDPEESARVCVAWLRRRQSSTTTGHRSPIPKAIVCPVHQREYSNLWLGTRLDYYEAVAWCKGPNKLNESKTVNN